MKKILLLTFLFINFLCEAQQKIAFVEWSFDCSSLNPNSFIGTDFIYELKNKGFVNLDYGISLTTSYDVIFNMYNKNLQPKISKIFGGNLQDKISCYCETSDGGYLLGMSSESNISGNKTENSKGGMDYWIVKLDVLGNISWQKTYGGNMDDEVGDVYQLNDGTFIVAGVSFSGVSGDKNEPYTSGGRDHWILRLNSQGGIIWQKAIPKGFLGYAIKVYELNNQIFLTTTSNLDANRGDDYGLWKLNYNTGKIEWQKTIGGNWEDRLAGSFQNKNGFLLYGLSKSNISGDKTENVYGGGTSPGMNWDIWIIQVDTVGNILWQNNVGTSGNESLYHVIPTSDTGCLIAARVQAGSEGDKSDTSRGRSDIWLIKLNKYGQIDWEHTYGGSNEEDAPYVLESLDGGYVMVCASKSPISGDKTEDLAAQPSDYTDYWIIKVDSYGKIEWQKSIDNDYGRDENPKIFQTSFNKYLITGGSNMCPVSLTRLAVISKYDSILGKTFQAKNTNCFQDPNEKGISKVILKTEPKGFFGISDTLGKYTILTDTGTYKVKQITPAILKPFLDGGLVCPATGYHTVSFSQYGQDTTEINFANYEKQCAFLQVELAQSRMRRCFDNTTAIKYCNIGNVDTNNVQVIVALPEYVTFVSASNPNYTISGKKITFNIGNLRANECGTINLVTHVDCVNGITGLTQCISAYITPRNRCMQQLQPDYAIWDKSEVSVDGKCTGSTVRFVIKNIGQNNMSDSSSYRIYKDAVQALNKKFKLNTGDSLVVNVTGTGHTYRLEADQALHYPSTSQPSITIENCGTGVASRGFVNQQAQDFAAPDVEKICLPIRDSYDPNDKQVSPSGVGANKLVPHKIPLDFLIRFQNTGTDTAYKVVITDTLSQNLDLSTLEFGASSHPYKIEFTGSGKPILKFTFDKINLVDSFTNEPKSHGFISFKITPYDSIPNGTLVKNNADIYFDFNLPIKTNTTQVSIDDRLPTGATLNLVTSVRQNNTIYEAIHVYPNPFTQTTNFEFVYNTKANQLIIYNVNGELVVQENVTGKTTFQLQRANLPNGMYFYNIQDKDGEIIGRGKLVLQ